MAGFALVGSVGGAAVASSLPAAVFKPLIICVLVGVALFVALRPKLGAATRLRYAGARHVAVACVIGFALGGYDGMFGPGTGAFLVIALVSALGYDFVTASAKAKIVNFATNLGALLLFVPTGSVVWGLGLAMAAGNMVGGYLGARTAIARGVGFVRAVFLTVVGILILRLGYDVAVPYFS